MRGMFSKITRMKNCGAKGLRTERGLSEGKILKMTLKIACPHATEGNRNQDWSPIKTRNYEAVLLEESATKMVNF